MFAKNVVDNGEDPTSIRMLMKARHSLPGDVELARYEHLAGGRRIDPIPSSNGRQSDTSSEKATTEGASIIAKGECALQKERTILSSSEKLGFHPDLT